MTSLDASVAAALAPMPLARLAHFTPSRNLPHIIADGELRSVTDMRADARACYSATDLQRLDGYPDKVCCSFQYPNGFYFDKARAKRDAVNYPDWVCLLLNKTAAATQGTLFCPRNAAAGRHLAKPGVEGLQACYAPSVTGQGGQTRSRGPRHDPGSATDVQAEVLITAPIPLSMVYSIVVPTKTAAKQEYGRLEQLGLLPPAHVRWIVCGDMFRKWRITNAVFDSQYLTETVWLPTSVGTA